jgi:hypothetical protein
MTRKLYSLDRIIKDKIKTKKDKKKFKKEYQKAKRLANGT